MDFGIMGGRCRNPGNSPLRIPRKNCNLFYFIWLFSYLKDLESFLITKFQRLFFVWFVSKLAIKIPDHFPNISSLLYAWKYFSEKENSQLFSILIFFFVYVCICVRAQPCPILCNAVDCSPPGCSVCGVSQTRKLEQVAISYSKGSSKPRGQTQGYFMEIMFNRIFLTAPPSGKPMVRRGMASFSLFSHCVSLPIAS